MAFGQFSSTDAHGGEDDEVVEGLVGGPKVWVLSVVLAKAAPDGPGAIALGLGRRYDAEATDLRSKHEISFESIALGKGQMRHFCACG